MAYSSIYLSRTILARCARRLVATLKPLNSLARQAWISTRFPELSFGVRVSIGPRVIFRITDGAALVIGSGTNIERDSTIIAKRGSIVVGEKSFIGHGCTIVANSAIQIGADCLIGEFVTIRDQNHGIEFSGVPFAKQRMVFSPISIGSNVWIGAKATVVAGVTIGPNSVVAANAVVTNDVPSWTVVGGVPARVLRKITPTGDCTHAQEAA